MASTGLPRRLALEIARRCRAAAIPNQVKDLIRDISLVNSLWGAPRTHGELLKLGIEVVQSTVAKYIVKQRHPPSQSWKTFSPEPRERYRRSRSLRRPDSQFQAAVRARHTAS